LTERVSTGSDLMIFNNQDDALTPAEKVALGSYLGFGMSSPCCRSRDIGTMFRSI